MNCKASVRGRLCGRPPRLGRGYCWQHDTSVSIPLYPVVPEGEHIVHFWYRGDDYFLRLCDDGEWPEGVGQAWPMDESDTACGCKVCLDLYIGDVAAGPRLFEMVT